MTQQDLVAVLPWRKKLSGLRSITTSGLLPELEYFKLAVIAWEMMFKFESLNDKDYHRADDFIKSSVYDQIYHNDGMRMKIDIVAKELNVPLNEAEDIMYYGTVASVKKLIVELSPMLGAVLPMLVDRGRVKYSIEEVNVTAVGLAIRLVDYPCRM